MPDLSKERKDGGHATVIIGYDDTKQCWEVRNSWGPDWGDGGHFWMPYAYTQSGRYCSDFWVVTAAEGP